ncbi:MAG: phenylalanine--tRNA ligase subunit beta [Lachnospiraceae bacterium]|nr:phenylalanine--tRNA ligase subunit beta [Lachnospiraceae bacterium]
MKVSLNWIKRYMDLPSDVTPERIAYDLTLRTVEVEGTEDTGRKYHDMVVGKILEVKKHPNADLLKICITDIGEDEPVQIVCGGSNLYEGEYVVVAKPGSEVIWHGEGEPVKLKETKMRGELSYGMICSATEVYLEAFFPVKDEREIVDLKGVACKPGQEIAELVCMNDTVLEIDNKSLTNRPDMWGHYGVARELAAIYDVPLKPLPDTDAVSGLPEYPVEIKEPGKCPRYVAVKIENLYETESPLWMKAALINGGMRPINAIVDITNYVMMAVGQPTHAFDSTHVEGGKILVRNAKKDEKLLLLDNNELDLTEDDLVICDVHDAMGLAGIRGGKKDSILPETTSVVLEIANFTAANIRKTGKRFDEKTDASIRYEKSIDTERVDQGLAMSLKLLKELFPESKVTAYADRYLARTERAVIDVPQEFLDIRLGKILSRETIERILKALGYDVVFESGIYHVTAPVWRSTGDVSMKDDVLGDIARLLSFESFEPKPLPVMFEHAVHQNDALLERRLREYLAYRCGFNEIYTYPWIDEKYIKAARIDTAEAVKLATPPAPEFENLRSSLIPGMLEAISKNLRYYDSFKMFEMAQVFEKGEYHESEEEETLPIHKKYLTGCVVGRNAREVFYEVKGVVEAMSGYCHMEGLSFAKAEKPSWADGNACLDVVCGEETIGAIGLLSAAAMSDSKIKRTNAAVFELNFDRMIPFTSRTNEFKSLPQFPLVKKDLSLLVDENVTWKEISDAIRSKVKELEFVEEYKGNQIPEGKKSIMLHVKIGKDDSTMTSEQINGEMERIIRRLNKMCGAELRAE